MLTLRRILFPTDDAPCADRAFAHAAFLAKHHGAELVVLRVEPVTGTEPGHGHSYPVPEGVDCETILERASSVAQAIVDQARRMDLVVMGTHGRRGVARLAVGSTTEQVLRQADCPVLAVGLDAVSDPESVDRILVPADFSSSSGPSLRLADALAELYDARVDVLHAAYLPDLPEIYEVGLQFAAHYPDVVARATESLSALAESYIRPERLGRVLVRVGHPTPTILEEAREPGVGLLVMPTHGRTGWARLAAGSVAEAVLRRAACPVVAIPSFGRWPISDDVARPVPASDLVADPS